MKTIIIHTENEQFEYQADYVSENELFVEVMVRENPKEKSWTEGALWWKEKKTYTDYDHRCIAMHKTSLVVRVEL